MDDETTMLVRDLIAAGVDASLIARVTGLAARVADLDRRRAADAARQRKRRSKLVVTGDHVTSQVSRDVTPPPHTPPPQGNSKRKSVSRSRGEPIPPDWQPDRDYARQHGFDEMRIDAEAERFRDHALSHGRLARDWNAAWRNWVTSPYQHPPNGGPRNGPRTPTMATAADDLITRAENFERENRLGDDHRSR